MQNQIFDRPLSLRMFVLRALLAMALRPLLSGSLHPVAARRRFERMVAPLARTPKTVTLRPGQLRGIPVEWTTPVGPPARGFTVYFHGGAFVFGSPRSFRRLTSRLAQRSNTILVSVDYRLAPEHSYPAALQDALQVYREMLAQGIDPRRVVFAGDSAGGGLAITAALAAREASLPAPAGVVALSPWTDLTLSGQSMIDERDAERLISVTLLRRAALAYVGNHTQLSAPEVSPLFADLQGLPPLLVQVAGREILRDDSLRLVQEAHLAGREVVLQQWPHLFHGWQGLAGLAPEADEAIEAAAAFVRERLG